MRLPQRTTVTPDNHMADDTETRAQQAYGVWSLTSWFHVFLEVVSGVPCAPPWWAHSAVALHCIRQSPRVATGLRSESTTTNTPPVSIYAAFQLGVSWQRYAEGAKGRTGRVSLRVVRGEQPTFSTSDGTRRSTALSAPLRLFLTRAFALRAPLLKCK